MYKDKQNGVTRLFKLQVAEEHKARLRVKGAHLMINKMYKYKQNV